jgi:hypothetical protein
MGDCPICCETYNKSTHTQITCPSCNESLCRTCVQKYLLSTILDPHCMNCKVAWDRECVDSACTKTFRSTKLKEHRENILFERQKCLLPETQPRVEAYVNMREIETEYKNLQSEIEQLQLRCNDLVMKRNIQERLLHGKHLSDKEKRDFVRKCPLDGCRGFLGSNWKCGVCKKDVCKHCNNEKLSEGEHECDPNDVETVKLLEKDTKACPKCGELIFKISGCPQMWCPKCHTAFNWNTLRIETGVIHNPHFLEYKRANGGSSRDLADIPCGGLPTLGELKQFPFYWKLHGILRFVYHVEHYTLPNIQIEPRDYMMHRVKYLCNEISESEFKYVLQKNEKSLSKNIEMAGMLRTWVNIMSDLFRQLVIDFVSWERYHEEMIKFTDYFNHYSGIISKRYNQKTYYISRSDSTSWYLENENY